MPREMHPPQKKPPVKGKPLGIPMWGWIAGAVLGLIIGYILIKNRGSSSTSDSGTGSSPLAGDQSAGSGGGVVASPPLASPLDSAGINDQPMAGNTDTADGNFTTTGVDTFAPSGGLASPTGFFSGSGIDPTFSMEQPQGAGGNAFQVASASGAGTYVPSIINNPAPPTGNISPYSPNLPRHALNIAAA